MNLFPIIVLALILIIAGIAVWLSITANRKKNKTKNMEAEESDQTIREELKNTLFKAGLQMIKYRKSYNSIHKLTNDSIQLFNVAHIKLSDKEYLEYQEYLVKNLK